MKNITITRHNGQVTFETVSINVTENVFFANEDPKAAHKPSICDDELGPAPSPASSECPVPVPAGNPPPPYTVTYTCELHPSEQGKINVFAVLTSPKPSPMALPQAAVNQPLPKPVQVVVGGKSPYQITDQLFEVTNNGSVIKSGSGSIGPGLQLVATPDNKGISVTGTPTIVGTYNFTFTVDDALEQNLQQVQYSMKVV